MYMFQIVIFILPSKKIRKFFDFDAVIPWGRGRKKRVVLVKYTIGILTLPD